LTTPHPRIILSQDVEKSRGKDGFWPDLRRRAAARQKTVLFPESTDPRVLSGCAFLAREKIVAPVLVGTPEKIRQSAADNKFSLAGVETIDATDANARQRHAEKFFEARKSKGVSIDEARRLMEDPLYFAVMALADGKAHGLVCGAVRTSADTVRAGFAGLGLAHGHHVVFGAFLMDCPNAAGGRKQVVFADAAVSPHPSSRALAAVGLGAAKFFKTYVGETPRVAYLSFSTRGSAEEESVALVRQAADLAKQKNPGLAIDGELQGDAALVPDIAAQKGAGESMVAGRANVLVFPDLNAGNIGYKLVQHLGGARAVGPVLWGLAKPMSDLSRGCNDEDVADAAVLVALMDPA